MAETKRVRNFKEINKLKAIESHAGYISFVIGKVKKIGIETILKQYQAGLQPPTEYYWLKKAYERVIEFAEQVQVKEIAQKVATEDEKGNIVPLHVYIPEIKSES